MIIETSPRHPTPQRADHDLARERGQMAAAIRAAELLGKSIGMFGDHPEIDPAIEEFKNLSVEQMRERIAQLVDDLGMSDVAERCRARTGSAPAKH